MIVKILAAQIPALWENIKFCAIQVNEVPKDIIPEYLNSLLQSLLSDKTQCFIRLDEQRTLIALMLTRVKLDSITKKSSLHIQCLYSFQKVADKDWQREYSFVRKFAKKLNCDAVTFDTRNEGVMRLGVLVGFAEIHRTFELKLGGI